MYNYKWCIALNYCNLIELPDEKLCLLSGEGSRPAEEVLADRYLALVRKCARPYFLVGGTSEDVIQEGMLGLLGAIREYNSEKQTSFKNFAERCIKNRIYSGMRAANREKHIPLNTYISIDPLSSDGQNSASIFPHQASDPEQNILDRESYDELFDELKGLLSDFEAEILGLYLEGLSIAEIANYCKRPQKSIENAVSRVRRKSARFLQHGDSR